MVPGRWLAIPLALVLALPATADPASHDAEAAAPNVLVKITVDEGKGHPQRTYRMLARGDQSRARMLTGWRVPIPSYSTGAGLQAAAGTSYTYQNVGMTAELHARSLAGDLVALRGSIEISAARESSAERPGAAPTIGTFEQGFSVLLEDGKPLELAEVANPEGGRLSIRLEAETLD